MTTKIINVAGIAAVAMSLGLTAFVSTSRAEDQLVTQAIRPVLQLERNCSAVVIDIAAKYPEFKDRTYLVTANHCVVEDAKSDQLEFNGKDKSGRLTIDEKNKDQILSTTQYIYDVVIRDTKNDTAMIRLRKDGLALKGAMIAERDPTLGENVWTTGYSLGIPNPTTTDGHWGGFISMDISDEGGREDVVVSNGVPKYTASPAIVGGNSGGGMFLRDDGNYKLVGIADMVAGRFANAGFYNPQGVINELVTKGLKNEKEAKDESKVSEDKRSQK